MTRRTLRSADGTRGAEVYLCAGSDSTYRIRVEKYPEHSDHMGSAYWWGGRVLWDHDHSSLDAAVQVANRWVVDGVLPPAARANTELLTSPDRRPAMTEQTPDTVTETIRVDQLTPGRTILMPCEPETVTEIWTAHGYVNFRTDKTGPASAYQWPAGDVVDVVRSVSASRRTAP